MWSGTLVAGDATYPEAVAACSTLTIDGRTGWRLPTLYELEAVLSSYETSVCPYADTKCTDEQMMDIRLPTLKWLGNQGIPWVEWLWSSTPASDGPGYYEMEGVYKAEEDGSKQTDYGRRGAFCVRTMEPEVLAAAQGADVLPAVSNLVELRARVPLSQAITAYSSGQYQSALDLSHQAIALDPTLGEAYYGAGIAEGMLGDWAEAATDLGKAGSLKATNANVGYAKSWVSNNQAAVLQHTTLNPQKNAPPAWSDP